MSVSSTASTPSIASSLASVNPVTSSSASGTPAQTLTAQDFMQLLTVQLENQDPTTPMDSNQEMQQIVQISSMQNMSTMSTDLTQMTASQTWSLANSYLGRQATLNDANGNPVSGQITAIDTSQTTPQVQVNGTYYPLTSVTSIQMASTSAPSSTSSTTPAAGSPATSTGTTSTGTTVTGTTSSGATISATLPTS